MFCPCFASEEYKVQRRINDQIDKQLMKEKPKYLMEEKLLLLGAGASGKSTILKQMRIIHGHGYKEKDRIMFISYIHMNIFNAIMSLIEAMKTLGVEYEDEETCEEYIDELGEIVHDEIEKLSDDNFENIKCIWQDTGIQKVYGKRNLFPLIDSAKYYLDSIDRIRDPSYIPSIDDVLHARISTSGIVDYSFHFDGIDIKMVDIGGQKSERRKWIHSFDKVTSIMFLAALSEYDEKPIDNPQFDNRLNETRNLFRSVINLEALQNASIILFLNKIDIFESKIQYSDIGKYFPDYNGPVQDPVKAKEFILELFLSDNPYHETKTIYSHYTCATDTKNIKVVFDGIKNTVLMKNMREIMG